MMFVLLLLAAAAVSPAPEAQISAVLDDWHAAAAVADEARYFGHFAPGAVFLGTDGTERWTVDEFRRYAHPYFAKGKAWSFRAVQRHVAFSPDGNVAWFDEDLQTPNLGPSRGSGVLVKTPEGWKIAQYNLTVPIPNAPMKEVKELIERSSREPQKP
jgi:ketosteroid isomerase-like protein